MLYLAALLRLHSNQGKIRKQIEEKKRQERSDNGISSFQL